MLEITIAPERTYAAYAEGRDGTETCVSNPGTLEQAHAASGEWAAECATRYLNGYSERARGGWEIYDGARYLGYVRARRYR
jgi:hypothetical protein